MNYREKYLKYKSKYLQLKASLKEMEGGKNLEDTDKTLYLFKAEWCGHCVNFKPVWNELQKTEKINFVTYDADTHKDEIKNFKIEGFPTLILKKGNEAIEYSGGRDVNSLKDFIKSY
jgi:thiol-disulfide isomerase/thioredoxin